MGVKSDLVKQNRCNRSTFQDALPYRHVRSPQSEVVAQELHDQGAVLVRFLAKGIQLCDCLIKGLQRFQVVRAKKTTSLACKMPEPKNDCHETNHSNPQK